MALAEDTIPPPPLQNAPIVDRTNKNPDINFSGWTFTNAWAQWFLNVKVKLDVINENLYQLANIVGAGIPSKDGSGNWTARAVAQGTGIVVTDGDGVSGNPTVAIDTTWTGDMSISGVGTLTQGTWQADIIDNAYLDAAPKMTVTSTSATGGAATALPALPTGYVEVDIGGVTKKIAYYD